MQEDGMQGHSYVRVPLPTGPALGPSLVAGSALSLQFCHIATEAAALEFVERACPLLHST